MRRAGWLAGNFVLIFAHCASVMVLVHWLAPNELADQLNQHIVNRVLAPVDRFHEIHQ
jgi:hypothetical protein